jgi:hypothetical protein
MFFNVMCQSQGKQFFPSVACDVNQLREQKTLF